MKPPRALAVPFELGRPFGAPNEAELQRKVLYHCLELLERDSGPVLEDFTELLSVNENEGSEESPESSDP